jgi:hypothetical protein
MASASPSFGSDQAPSFDAADVRLDRFPCDLADRAPPARSLVTQLRIEIIGKLDCCAPHGMPAYVGQLRTSSVGVAKDVTVTLDHFGPFEVVFRSKKDATGVNHLNLRDFQIGPNGFKSDHSIRIATVAITHAATVMMRVCSGRRRPKGALGTSPRHRRAECQDRRESRGGVVREEHRVFRGACSCWIF